MKVYFYHTQDIQRIVREWAEGRFPGHFLYGATRLGDSGIDVVYHKHWPTSRRWLMMVYVAWSVLTCRERFDAIYATHYKGLEIIIFLRALGLFRHPIVLWHHHPMRVKATSLLRRPFSHLFYKGIDEMIFFSDKLLRDSLASPNARPERMHVGHWGADLDFYDRIMATHGTARRHGFISTGKEHRDMPTLVEAFNATGESLAIHYQSNFHHYFTHARLGENIKAEMVIGLLPYELSIKVNEAECVVVCCEETDYTAGLTTVVEALALGLPTICSRNPQIPVDFERDGCGISVAYGDVEGWKRAVSRIASHPDEARQMGRKARLLAETRFNDRQNAAEVAEIIKAAVGKQ